MKGRFRPRHPSPKVEELSRVLVLDGRPAIGAVMAKTPIRAFVASADQFRALESDETVALRLFHYALARLREDLEST